MKKYIFSSLTLASILFVTSVANAGEYSVAKFYTQMINIGFIKGMQNKDIAHVLTQTNLDCLSMTHNDSLMTIMDKNLRSELTVTELQQTNQFLDSRIGQILQNNFLTNARNRTNTNALAPIDVNQFSDTEINDFMNFAQSPANEKIFVGNSMQRILSQPEVKKSLAKIAKDKITTCGLSPNYFFK